jgi:hypothetical protein
VVVLRVIIDIVFAACDYAFKDRRVRVDWRWALQVLEIVGCVADPPPHYLGCQTSGHRRSR